mmetsp:Transcript_39556/g.58174  ORF Transcript_39556/g.58174 Transcript_39556/m.58174 type:complete len:331 (-) Transcript_39556:150-1142(-)
MHLKFKLKGVGVAQILASHLHSLHHSILRLANPDTRIVVLLVGLLFALGVANLSLKVTLLLLVEQAQAIPVCPLGVCVYIHLYHTSIHCSPDLLLSGTRATMHHKVDRLVLGVAGTKLCLHKLLVSGQNARVEHHIARLVHTMHIAKGSSNREVGADGTEVRDHIPDLLRLSVKLVLIHVFIIHAILFTTSDTNLHLEPDVHSRHLLKVHFADTNVLLVGFLGEIKHVGAEQRLAILLEIVLVSGKHTIEPRKKLLRTVIRVENDRNAVVGSHLADVKGQGNGTCNGCLLLGLLVIDALTSVENAATVGDLDNAGHVQRSACLHGGIGSA